MKLRSLLWKIPLALTGVLVGIVVLLLIAVATVLYEPSVRQKVLDKGLAVANEKTDFDIDLGRLYLSPFHHSPMVLYRAYKGEADLPVRVEIDSLFVGHRGVDTLVYARALRLQAIAKTSTINPPLSEAEQFIIPPIVVDTLLLDHVTFHSDSLIAAVGVDAIVGQLAVSSPQISIPEGRYPLHGLRLSDANVGIDLRSTTTPDTLPKDTTPLLLAFELPDGELRNIHFRLTPLNMDIRTKSLSTEATVDVGANKYDARRLNVGGFAFDLNSLHIPADTIYGGACADIARNIITSRGLHVRSSEIGATADLEATKMDLNTMQAETSGEASFQGSKATLKAFYDINNEAYDATVHIDRVNLSPFLKDSTRIVIAGDLEAAGKGINPKRPLSSRIHLRLDKAIYEAYDLSHTDLRFATDTATSLTINTRGLDLAVDAPMPLFPLIDKILPLVKTVSDSAVLASLTSLEDLTVLDTIRRRIPPINADIALRKGSPIQFHLDSTGLEIEQIDLSLRSDSLRTDIAVDAAASPFNLQRSTVNLNLALTEGHTDASLLGHTAHGWRDERRRALYRRIAPHGSDEGRERALRRRTADARQPFL